ncbi:hypothetical protein Pmani_027569 [Petrolisthes manimaculis]|uniref:Uncharacterized protein n=1 Tax=Petrolisthes manimaculis TaxID=1843537 RepID=A0AAE1P2F9_9EUCA|nr:hypothetical protein Pmani_027569 [Petrolisthes manimaculis]
MDTIIPDVDNIIPGVDITTPGVDITTPGVDTGGDSALTLAGLSMSTLRQWAPVTPSPTLPPFLSPSILAVVAGGGYRQTWECGRES